ncbi:MAG TPA: type II toxin-antitoxin system antitoxin SocA domain-containing protein [Sumerlaeia bacterium]|nr:type II toxin-antitoxin system antitoxin SocA domain-containing protein [Sumerlaeia bacterium]
MAPVSAHDVAAYILCVQGEMTAMKLQKLVYYCQAWSLVWDEEPLFKERIEAWANGPVVVSLYDKHRGLFKVPKWPDGNPEELNQTQRETVDAVLGFYGDKPSQWLSDLTHMEDPWKNARGGLSPGERGSTEIAHAAMMEYYSSL